MSAHTPPLRLAAIRLCGYRGFPDPVTIWLAQHDKDWKQTGKGRNLLLYGENGSGKSSLGKAVRDLLDFRSTAVPFDEFKYRHSEPPRTDRGVTFIFDDPSVVPLEWNPTSRDTAHHEFADMARSRGWLDYRAVWRASEVKFGDSVEMFRQLVEEILPSCLPDSGGTETFGQAWGRITSAAANNPTRNAPTRDAVVRLQTRIKTFNDTLQSFLATLETRANDFLKEFVPWTSLVLEWGTGAAYNPSSHKDKFVFGSIKLKMKDRGGEPLKNPSEFLNEARMTAIGLCLYLAGMSQSIPPRRSDGSSYPRLLVLDDVLLSLDMVHRMPLLKLLKNDCFGDWQIFLLTHDRAWYEMSKQHLEGWAHHELFAQRVGDYEQPLLREDQDHLLQAIDFLHVGHVKAAAVHMRTKFELVLKWACHELDLAVKYNPDLRKVPASDFWAAVNGASFEKIPPVVRRKNSASQLHWWQPKPYFMPVVPVELKDRVTKALRWVLNPLSHSESADHYRPEIEDAIFAVNDLEIAVREAIAMRHAGPVLLREMLLSLLNSRRVLLASPVSSVPATATPP